MKDKKIWMVTVHGYDPMYDPPSVIISKMITLPDNETPIDWFWEFPTLYSRFSFTPDALLNFWEIPTKNKCVVYPTECPNKCEMTTFWRVGKETHIWECKECGRIIDLRIENEE